MEPVTQMTTYQSESRQLEGYLARPEGEGPFPGNRSHTRGIWPQ